jgi:hypothetical protein
MWGRIGRMNTKRGRAAVPPFGALSRWEDYSGVRRLSTHEPPTVGIWGWCSVLWP